VRYLVTGGAGFIGSSLVRHLLGVDSVGRPLAGPAAPAVPVEVVTLDKLTYAGHVENLSEVSGDPRHRFVEGDVCDVGIVRELVQGVDVVFHLAAESHVDRSIIDDRPFVRTNVLGTATLLAAVTEVGIERFVQVSTDEVYGELPWVDPESEAGRDAPRFTEETPLSPRSPYAATKAAADHLVSAYHVTHGLDVVITRGCNTYGPRQHPEKLLPVLIRKALADAPLPLYGDGLNVRDWIHVDDHCRGILAAARKGRPGRVYNLGARAERTNLSLARSVLAILGKPESLIDFVEDRPGHDRRYAVDASRARTELDWVPRSKLLEQLAACGSWYRANQAWIEAVSKPRS
jgi:dTDP-glucose 4,6-dehydratase